MITTQIAERIECEVKKILPYVTNEQIIEASSIVSRLIGEGEEIPPKTFINLLIFVLVTKI